MHKQLALMVSVAALTAGFCWFAIDSSRSTANAMTATVSENKSLVTVPLDAGMSAIVSLDHVTGDITGYVLNRMNGQFFIRYRYNLNDDFPGHKSKFLVAAATADFRGFQTQVRLASGVFFVSEETSGKVCAYGLPWNTNFRASGVGPQDLQFIKLDEAATRFTALR